MLEIACRGRWAIVIIALVLPALGELMGAGRAERGPTWI
jgi:hypothetical protein